MEPGDVPVPLNELRLQLGDPVAVRDLPPKTRGSPGGRGGL